MQNYKNTTTRTEQTRMIASGEKERFCLTELVDELNVSENFRYELLISNSSIPISYDGILYVRDKLTNRILNMYLVEVKVRDTNITYDELIFEKLKLTNLRKERDQFVRHQLPTLVPEILYIQFTSDGTYLFFIDEIIKENLLPTITSMSMNKMTVADNVKKVDKLVYLLPKEIAMKKKFKFNCIEYNNNLLIDIVNKAEYIQNENIKKIKSLF